MTDLAPQRPAFPAGDPVLVAASLAAIVDSSDDAIVSKTLDGTVVSWNGGAERLFGFTAAEAVGKSIRIIVPSDRQHEEDEVLRRIGLGERIDHYETVRQRKDGSFVDISLTVSPVRNSEGVVVGASKIARDITDRKVAEKALAESMELKNQFLSLVSHELRTPISIILGNGHLLQKRAEALSPEDRTQALADLTSEAERLQRIIENLLILTRAEAADRFDREVVKVERIADEVAHAFARRTGRCVVVESGRELPPVFGEPTVTRMVIENLLSNADKYSPWEQTIDVRVFTAGGAVETHVLDRGIGLSDEDQRSVFDAFYRSPTARDRASGMGLGLAVCRKVIEMHGGTITATPRAGGGSDFGFALPIASVPEE